MNAAGSAAARGNAGDLFSDPGMPTLPFKLNQHRRQHSPKQTHKLTNPLGALLRSWRAYDASLRQRSSLTVWFTADAIAAWQAEPRTTQGGQRWHSPMAILTALALRAVFHPALCQTRDLIGSAIGRLELTPAVPDHSTSCRRAEMLEVPRPWPRRDGKPLPLLVDSTDLMPCAVGEWLLEKHGTRMRRSPRKRHTGLDADTGQIAAAALTTLPATSAPRSAGMPAALRLVRFRSGAVLLFIQRVIAAGISRADATLPEVVTGNAHELPQLKVPCRIDSDAPEEVEFPYEAPGRLQVLEPPVSRGAAIGSNDPEAAPSNPVAPKVDDELFGAPRDDERPEDDPPVFETCSQLCFLEAFGHRFPPVQTAALSPEARRNTS